MINILIFSCLFLSVIVASGYLFKQERISKNIFDRNHTTIIKGVAIILIMLSHCTCLWNGGRIFTPCGGIGVAMFLLCSGYGLNQSYKQSGTKGFWRKRLSKVWIPYAIITLIEFFVRNWDIKELLLRLFAIHCTYWFIPYIIKCYIVFWFFSTLLPRYRLLCFTVAATISLFTLPGIEAEQAASFLSGIIVSEKMAQTPFLKADKRKTILVALGVFILGCTMLTIKQIPLVREIDNIYITNTIQLLIKWPICIAITVWCFSSKHVNKNRFLFLSGTLSYELYLIHFPFYGYIQNLLWPAILLIVCAYLASWGFHRINKYVCQFI